MTTTLFSCVKSAPCVFSFLWVNLTLHINQLIFLHHFHNRSSCSWIINTSSMILCESVFISNNTFQSQLAMVKRFPSCSICWLSASTTKNLVYQHGPYTFTRVMRVFCCCCRLSCFVCLFVCFTNLNIHLHEIFIWVSNSICLQAWQEAVKAQPDLMKRSPSNF